MRILVADDELGRLRLDGLLRNWGHEPVKAADGDEAWAVVQRDDAPAMALIDWMMPGMDGVEICRRLRATELCAYVYVALLTANDRQADVIAGLEAGAGDYVVKPFAPQELKLRLRAGRRIVEPQDALRSRAVHDVLTGAWNRSGIRAFLARELARSARSGRRGDAAIIGERPRACVAPSGRP